MKILSYNISDSKQWKIDRLFEHDADVLVVPEITCPEQAKLPEGYEMAWNGITWQYAGQDKWKGLGVIWKRGEGKVPAWYNPNLYDAIPLIIKGIVILAIWPTKRKGVTDKKFYPQIAQEVINEYAPYFEGKGVIVIGDFNCYVNQRDSSKEYGDILRTDEILNRFGLKSAYHQTTGETLGNESVATYYHTFRADLPFFIDYAYTNMEIKTYELMPWDSKMSDHVGQIKIVSSNPQPRP